MSQIESACNALEKHVSIIKYLGENYPDILKQWKNGALNAATDETTCHEQSEAKAHDT
jgi:hypothetical protein